jgi:hypothetical protein
MGDVAHLILTSIRDASRTKGCEAHRSLQVSVELVGS